MNQCQTRLVSTEILADSWVPTKVALFPAAGAQPYPTRRCWASCPISAGMLLAPIWGGWRLENLCCPWGKRKEAVEERSCSGWSSLKCGQLMNRDNEEKDRNHWPHAQLLFQDCSKPSEEILMPFGAAVLRKP